MPEGGDHELVLTAGASIIGSAPPPAVALEVNGVIRSTDSGETWADCSDDLIRLSELPHLKSKIVSDSFSEGMLDGHAIAISPARS